MGELKKIVPLGQFVDKDKVSTYLFNYLRPTHYLCLESWYEKKLVSESWYEKNGPCSSTENMLISSNCEISGSLLAQSAYFFAIDCTISIFFSFIFPKF